MHAKFVRRFFAGLALWTATAAAEFDPGLAAFDVRFGDVDVHYRVFAVTALPGKTVEVSIPRPEGSGFRIEAEADAAADSIVRVASASWRWTAPARPGLYPLALIRDDGATVRLNAFVLRPFGDVRDGELDGYRIGQYPRNPLRGNPIYLAPPGFVEVTPDRVGTEVSPHFTLGQFLCKQQPEAWPKYLVLRELLVTKLETLLAETNRRGIRTDGFFIMSGFRTPHYNAAIGNTAYSRHVWGGAADIFIDTDGDGVMDDLDGDGRTGIEDARVLQRIAQDLSEDGVWRRLLGGLGLYGPRIHRGAFVHVDARGARARWEVP